MYMYTCVYVHCMYSMYICMCMYFHSSVTPLVLIVIIVYVDVYYFPIL